MTTPVIVSAHLVYLCFTVATGLAYWKTTQSCFFGNLLPLPATITKEIEITTANGWHIRLDPTDNLRLVAASAGLLWPAYLLFCVAYRLAKKVAA